MIKETKNNRDKSGFTLIEVLVSTVLLGISAISFIKLGEFQNSATRRFYDSSDHIFFLRVISNHFNNKQSCNQTLNGLQINNSSAPSNIALIRNSDASTYFTPGTTTGAFGDIVVESMTALAQNATDLENPKQVNITCSMRSSKQGYGPANITRSFSLLVYASAAGNITSCYTESDAINESICASMDSIYDQITETCGLNPFIPQGMVMGFNGTDCPAGWVEADGTQSPLDLRGRYVRGMNAGKAIGPEADYDNRALGSSQSGSIVNHVHEFRDVYYNNCNGTGNEEGDDSGFCKNNHRRIVSGFAFQDTEPAGTANEVRIATTALRYCIKI